MRGGAVGGAVAVMIGLAVGGVAVVGARRAGDPPRAAAAAPELSREQERMRLFWEQYRAATRHRIAGRAAEAAAAYARSLELDSVHEDALYYLGNVQMERGLVAEAEAAWERLAEINPSSARAHARLGDLRLCVEGDGLPDPARAAASFERALRINQEQTGPLLRLGQAALLQGDLVRAAGAFDAVLGSNPESSDAHFHAGYVAWKRGDRAAAEVHFRAAVARARPGEAGGAGAAGAAAGAADAAGASGASSGGGSDAADASGAAGASAGGTAGAVGAPAAGGPGGPVVGEGDTRTGTAPMLAAEVTCQLFQPHLDGLRDPALEPEMEQSYAGLHAMLERLRPVAAAPQMGTPQRR